MALAPFRQLAFAEVPEKPRLPHVWADTIRRDVHINTPELGRCRISVREHGKGPPLVLVHGLMNPGYSWRYVLEPLGKRFRLVIPDLPGGGESDCPDVYLGPDVMARALAATIDAVGVRGAPVIGNSMGGYLSMRAAMHDPGVMSRLVNLHSPGVPTAKHRLLRYAMRLLPSWFLLERLVRKNPEKWVHKNIHYYDETLKCREDHRHFAAPLRTRAGRRGFYRHLRDTMDTKPMGGFVKALRERGFPVPLLLVYAEKDPIVPPSVGDKLAALVPSAKLIKMAEASHFAHIDAAPRFVEAVLPFLET
jgi:pimeloyl-ACP methyl ester carboxylesterase